MNNLSKRIEEQKEMKEMKRAIGKIEFVVCKNVEDREDGMELVEIANRIHQMLVNMNSLNLTMVNGNKEELEILDIDVDWEVVVNKDGTDHSWFEIVDGKKVLVRATDIKKEEK